MTLATELPKGLFQVVFGLAGDRFGRKKFLVGGLGLSGLAVALMGIVGASSGSDVYTAFCFLGVLLGIGTSAMYTNCQAAVADMSRPQWRSTAVGTYRFVRDMGYVFGAVMSGIMADTIGTSSSIGLCGGFLMLVACVVWRYFDLERDKIQASSVTRSMPDLSPDSKGSNEHSNAVAVDEVDGEALNALRILMLTHSDMLQSTFDAVNELFGSWDEMRRTGLGISDERMDAFRSAVLTKSSP